jgi:hypothetical protein
LAASSTTTPDWEEALVDTLLDDDLTDEELATIEELEALEDVATTDDDVATELITEDAGELLLPPPPPPPPPPHPTTNSDATRTLDKFLNISLTPRACFFERINIANSYKTQSTGRYPPSIDTDMTKVR